MSVVPKPAVRAGATILPRNGFEDSRGSLVELYQRSEDLPDTAQWTLFTSAAHSLRGMHIHTRKTDLVVVASGRLVVGLIDVRRSEPTYLERALFEVDAARPELVMIPPGVAHGFLAMDSCSFVVGTTTEYDPTDDLACRFDDPELGLAWPIADPTLSERDANAGTLAELAERFDAS